ncbi:tRNA uracil 4-sulfurtransferase ThiI [Mesoplasma lactucae]|uniref:Probable tRNA sulfurtransferase n=1 Tax=Mesoplasma lactucae ATCC 49193 TaxID=81460 RepID=A0A291IS20_9MOLU|nr:tRNA uracil 4-sulfurtransferase ThiI [Mesoplasma lactucae]ATG97560.1 tRNA 4-thiouridine(8) synthase ThiI [Mesoplasma lactucae ATCC 49193]ATZ19981.1 thiamine biosynthesis protein ThiI [Mesoplasma lactucae ATCC 49193]MCL8217068.1 putative tRNA sulfurtransferase [Mesoplasma lactucae ATCC 49193]
MKNVLVRYGELTLKGGNRRQFITKLIQNIKFRMKPYNDKVELIKDNNSCMIKVEDDYLDRLLADLQTVFGIYSLSVVETTSWDFEEITKKVLAMAIESAKEAKTFKLEVKRKDKAYPMTSTEMKQKLAPVVLQNTDLKVDVHNPDLKIEVVVKKDHVDIFHSRIKALKGLPVGVSGRGLSLLSGGIDSPVASFLTMKRGMSVDFVHFMTPPHTSPEALNKVFALAKQVAKYNYQTFNLYVVDFGKMLQELNHIPNQTYKITIMRRMFMRIANRIAKRDHQQALITGESLGQVASQTIESMSVINETSKLPILRPVLTNDKEDIIKISKRINTYDISILPFDDVCSMFVPENPVTKPRPWIAEEQEEAIMWEPILDWTVENEVKKFVFHEGEFVEDTNWSKEIEKEEQNPEQATE